MSWSLIYFFSYPLKSIYSKRSINTHSSFNVIARGWNTFYAARDIYSTLTGTLHVVKNYIMAQYT